MLKVYQKFFQFCSKENRSKFYRSIIYGLLIAFFEAFKIPAIYLILDAMLQQSLSVSIILTSFGILIGSIILQIIVRYRSTMLQCEAGYGTSAEKRIEIAEHLRYLPMGYFNQNSLGSITSITTNVMENLGDVATRVVMLTSQGVLATLFILLMIYISDYRLGIVTSIGIILFFLVNHYLQKKSQKVLESKVKADEKLVEKVVEYIQGIAEVKAYHMDARSSKRIHNAIQDNRNWNIQCEKSFIPYMAIQNIITKLTGIIMILCSIYFYFHQSMNLTECIVMMICSFMIYNSLEQAGNYSALLRVVDLSVDQAQKILSITPMDTTGKEIIPSNYNIELKNVSFSYQNKEILHQLSLFIPQHTTTAIVGPSGSGKTTICQLIARFWDVNQGEVSLGGINVKEYSIDCLMKYFSFVFQDVYLFQDTIANNIKFGKSGVSDEEMIEAAKQACCHDFIMKLPNGYQTIIKEGGASLSGGEKQRISIARAILKDAPIIILDEATANIDPENEEELIHAIEALTKEKTIIMIAHRLKTVQQADQVIVVDQGKIVQQGTHIELIQQEGIYQRFIQARQQAVSWKLH